MNDLKIQRERVRWELEQEQENNARIHRINALLARREELRKQQNKVVDKINSVLDESEDIQNDEDFASDNLPIVLQYNPSKDYQAEQELEDKKYQASKSNPPPTPPPKRQPNQNIIDDSVNQDLEVTKNSASSNKPPALPLKRKSNQNSNKGPTSNKTLASNPSISPKLPKLVDFFITTDRDYSHEDEIEDNKKTIEKSINVLNACIASGLFGSQLELKQLCKELDELKIKREKVRWELEKEIQGANRAYIVNQLLEERERLRNKQNMVINRINSTINKLEKREERQNSNRSSVADKFDIKSNKSLPPLPLKPVKSDSSQTLSKSTLINHPTNNSFIQLPVPKKGDYYMDNLTSPYKELYEATKNRLKLNYNLTDEQRKVVNDQNKSFERISEYLVKRKESGWAALHEQAKDLNRLVEMEMAKPEYDPLKKRLRELTKEYDEFKETRRNVHNQLKAKLERNAQINRINNRLVEREQKRQKIAYEIASKLFLVRENKSQVFEQVKTKSGSLVKKE